MFNYWIDRENQGYQPAILITGGASGIGAQTARRFHRAGWFVGVVDLNVDGLSNLADELGNKNVFKRGCDVTSVEDVEATLKEFTDASKGRLDIMFNCAGVLSTGPFINLDIKRHILHCDVNSKGVVICTKLAIPYLTRTGTNTGLINMASASSFFGVPEFASYSASKHFVKGLTEALNIELYDQGINVFAISPGFVDTPMVHGTNELNTTCQRMNPDLISVDDVVDDVWDAAHRYGTIGYHYKPGLKTKLLASVVSFGNVFFTQSFSRFIILTLNWTTQAREITK
eukprot:Clim_evm52s215 gene=Clim_evmTU52s215